MRRTMVASWGLVLLFAVTACATQPAAGGWSAAEAEIGRCFTAMDADPALGAVNAKYARRNPTPVQLADAAFASPAESDALRLRVQKTRPCRELRLAAVAEFRPLETPSYRTLYYQADQVIAYLADGWISYGTANRLALDSFQAFEQRGTALGQSADPAALSSAWDEALQRAHSNPPPDRRVVSCAWEDLNLACAR